MTDNEIIEALECCKSLHHTECACCPLDKNKNCIENLAGCALDLINRQNAEIENYSHNNRNMTKDIRDLQKALELATAKIQRYKQALRNANQSYRNFLKEMAGEMNA